MQAFARLGPEHIAAMVDAGWDIILREDLVPQGFERIDNQSYTWIRPAINTVWWGWRVYCHGNSLSHGGFADTLEEAIKNSGEALAKLKGA